MGGGSNPYKSPNMGWTDMLAGNALLAQYSGMPIAPDPALNSAIIAQRFGGTYNPKTDSIKLPDGSVIRYDVASGGFTGASGKGSSHLANYGSYMDANNQKFTSPEQFQNYILGGGVAYTPSKTRQGTRQPVAIDPKTFSGASDWATRANDILTNEINPNVYNEDSPLRMMGEAFGNKLYDPSTGTMVDASTMPNQLTSDYYMNQFGGYLDEKYNPYQYQEYGPYNEFGFESNKINTVDPINEEITNKEIARAQDEVNQSARARAQGVENFIAGSGGSLNSGRAARLMGDVQMDQARENAVASDKIQREASLRSFYDAQSVRDQQASQDMKVQELKANESRFGFESGRDESRNKQAVAQEENQRAFDTGQAQGKEKFVLGSAADTDAYNRAFQQNQANIQNSLNRSNFLQNMIGMYLDKDTANAQIKASEANALTGAVTGMVGSAAGGATSAI